MASVDLLIATRNDDHAGLKRTLTSIQQSKYLDIRIILINDSCKSIPNEALVYGPIPVQIVEIGKNVGLTISLSTGANQSNAPFIARTDVGDEILPERISSQVMYLEKNPECVLVGCATELFVVYNDKPLSIGTTIHFDNCSSLNHLLRRTNPLVHGSIMMRSDAFRKVGGYDCNVGIAQDVDLYLRMMRIGTLAILDKVLHRHAFYIKSSTTLKRNRESIKSAFRSRLRYLTIKEKMSVGFIIGAIRDIVLLSMPATVLRRVRISLLIRRSNAVR